MEHGPTGRRGRASGAAPAAAEILVRGRMMVLHVDRRTKSAWLDRTTDVIGADEAIAELDEMERRLTEQMGRRASQWRVVVDTRKAIGRNDSEFDQRILPRILELTQLFGEVGVLVRTVVGRMQVERVSRERGLNHRAFTDEDAARRFFDRTG